MKYFERVSSIFQRSMTHGHISAVILQRGRFGHQPRRDKTRPTKRNKRSAILSPSSPDPQHAPGKPTLAFVTGSTNLKIRSKNFFTIHGRFSITACRVARGSFNGETTTKPSSTGRKGENKAGRKTRS
jgi:hypothetical protein